MLGRGLDGAGVSLVVCGDPVGTECREWFPWFITEPEEVIELERVCIEDHPGHASSWLVCEFEVDGHPRSVGAGMRSLELDVAHDGAGFEHDVVSGGIDLALELLDSRLVMSP